MAGIFYFSVEDKQVSDDKQMFEIPLEDCVRLFDLRPKQRECGLDEFPNLLTGNPLVDSGGYIHVLLRVSADEAGKSAEKGYESGWYKTNMTVIEIQSIIAEARKSEAGKNPEKTRKPSANQPQK